jgi:hypothetical protein
MKERNKGHVTRIQEVIEERSCQFRLWKKHHKHLIIGPTVSVRIYQLELWLRFSIAQRRRRDMVACSSRTRRRSVHSHKDHNS